MAPGPQINKGGPSLTGMEAPGTSPARVRVRLAGEAELSRKIDFNDVIKTLTPQEVCEAS